MRSNLLVLDTIIGPSGNFVRAMDKIFGSGGYTHVRTADWPPAGDLEAFTHLLISGSGLMAGEPHENDDLIEGIIRDFVARGRCVLGICYGHQMVVRSLAGIQNIIRCAEFGLQSIQLMPNPLFVGIGGEGARRLVSLCSHFEEVSGLPPEFRVIATGEPCRVQAVQYRDLPVWGTQFHPEYTLDVARDKTRRNKEKYEDARRLARDLPIEQEVYDTQNRLIFRNFLRSQPVEKS
ncbi:MAG: gamma-glutamyl-gamma-aminobutyrate hydrolase family protein [Candidatus Cloacimonetes bacterium]|nr:gamma-glutamyl-gamma-aminobutyrate hydrolase family protein [Candidatus Cloacimonadota bacterium]